MSLLRKIILYDANGRELELSSNSNIPIELINSDGSHVDVHHPVPTDGDSVYHKDVWDDESDIGDFSGSISDLFDNLHTVIANTTATNPKEILIHFKRTIVTNAIGLGSFTGSFSNVEIQAGNSGGIFTTLIDESSSSTLYTSRTFQLPVTSGMNAIKIIFHTTNTISLSNVVVLKSNSVVARLQATKPAGTVTDINATNGGNLKVSVEEFESGISVNSNSQLKVTPYDSSGNEVSGKIYDESTSAYRGLIFNSGSPQFCSQDYLYAIAEGDIAGHDLYSKFGRVVGVSTSIVDVWPGEGGIASTYVFPTTAQQIRVVSTSANDASGGTGANTVVLTGLDSNYDEISETITMTGLTVATTSNSFLRVNGCYVATAGSLGSAAGTITFKNSTGTPDTITYSSISSGLTACRQLIYTVPSGKTLYLTSMVIGSGDGGNSLKLNAVIFTPKFRLFGSSVFIPQGELFAINGETVRVLEAPAKIPEKTDVKMSVQGDYASASTTCIGAVRGWIE